MKLSLAPDSTSVIVHVFLPDSSSSTGAGKTALVHSDITAYYVRAGGTLTALTMETIATLGTWASSGSNYLGFKLLHDTNAPGLYELHLPNNILASGSNQVTIMLRASTIVPISIEIQLGAHTNIKQIADNATAAVAMRASLLGVVVSAVNDAGASTTSFITDLTEATTDHYKDLFLVFTSGALIGQSRKISAYNGTSKAITLATALTDSPANNDEFVVLGRSE